METCHFDGANETHHGRDSSVSRLFHACGDVVGGEEVDGHNVALGPVDEFLPKHFALAAYIARKHMGNASGFGTDTEDMIAVARFGLWKAYCNFNPANGVKWATFASVCIENECRKQHRRNRKHRDVGYLEHVVSENEEGGSVSLYDFVGTTNIDTTKIDVDGFLSSLKERDREIVAMRLDGAKQGEIAERLNISRSYISRICKRIGNRYLKGEWTMIGDKKRATELARTTEMTDKQIRENTGVTQYVMSKIRADIAAANVAAVNVARDQVVMLPEAKVTVRADDDAPDNTTNPDATLADVHIHMEVNTNTEKPVSLLDRIERLQWVLTSAMDELGEIKAMAQQQTQAVPNAKVREAIEVLSQLITQ